VNYPELLTVAEVAKVLRCGVRTVQRYVDQGKLSAVKLSAHPSGRVLIRVDSLNKLINEGTTVGAVPGASAMPVAKGRAGPRRPSLY
jgi:excisionase family DNA binding protein